MHIPISKTFELRLAPDRNRPINFKKSAMSPFGSNEEAIDFSDKTSQEIDTEVTRLVKENHQLATNILNENREALDRLAEGLILWETLEYSQVKDLVDGKDIGMPIVEKTEVAQGSSLGADTDNGELSESGSSIDDGPEEDPQLSSKNNSEGPATA